MHGESDAPISLVLHFSADICKATSLLAPMTAWKACDPVTIQHLNMLHTHLDFEDPFDVTIFAVACLAFWSQARLGELLFDNAFDPLLHIAWNGIIFGVTTSNR